MIIVEDPKGRKYLTNEEIINALKSGSSVNINTQLERESAYKDKTENIVKLVNKNRKAHGLSPLTNRDIPMRSNKDAKPGTMEYRPLPNKSRRFKDQKWEIVVSPDVLKNKEFMEAGRQHEPIHTEINAGSFNPLFSLSELRKAARENRDRFRRMNETGVDTYSTMAMSKPENRYITHYSTPSGTWFNEALAYMLGELRVYNKNQKDPNKIFHPVEYGKNGLTKLLEIAKANPKIFTTTNDLLKQGLFNDPKWIEAIQKSLLLLASNPYKSENLA